jgi:hypothetical protein
MQFVLVRCPACWTFHRPSKSLAWDGNSSFVAYLGLQPTITRRNDTAAFSYEAVLVT